jgi:hypothetical protein
MDSWSLPPSNSGEGSVASFLHDNDEETIIKMTANLPQNFTFPTNILKVL